MRTPCFHVSYCVVVVLLCPCFVATIRHLEVVLFFRWIVDFHRLVSCVLGFWVDCYSVALTIVGFFLLFSSFSFDASATWLSSVVDLVFTLAAVCSSRTIT